MVSPPVFPSDRVTIIGVLNATPDSFSDGGLFVDRAERVRVEVAVDAAAALLGAGADWLDIGGESTRPGAREVPVAIETARVVPVVEALAKRFDAPISIDTRKGEVAEAALDAGAAIVNDVSGLGFDPQVASVAARAGAILVLGHLRGTPETMQRAPEFADVLEEVAVELESSVERARAAGVARPQLAVDPGLGFGKNLEQNLTLLAHPGWLRQRLGLPVVLGPSRKSFLGAVTGEPVDRRDPASWAACAIAAFAGVDAVRVHAPAGAAAAVALGRALANARREGLS
ncbi:MAG: dihydropteroate synthase [Myxococcota bacterium]